MSNLTTWEIRGHIVEYDDDCHEYIVDGLPVPSVTQVIKRRFPQKYDGITQKTLDNAARIGTLLHLTIEMLEKYKEIPNIPEEVRKEVLNYRGLKKYYGFEAVEMEKPIIIPYNGEIVCAGRFDMLARMNMETGLIDIKRTAQLDKEYLAYQLTLYALGYKYSYDGDIAFLRCLHLKDDKYHFAEIPFIYAEVDELLKEAAEDGI